SRDFSLPWKAQKNKGALPTFPPPRLRLLDWFRIQTGKELPPPPSRLFPRLILRLEKTLTPSLRPRRSLSRKGVGHWLSKTAQSRCHFRCCFWNTRMSRPRLKREPGLPIRLVPVSSQRDVITITFPTAPLRVNLRGLGQGFSIQSQPNWGVFCEKASCDFR